MQSGRGRGTFYNTAQNAALLRQQECDSARYICQYRAAGQPTSRRRRRAHVSPTAAQARSSRLPARASHCNARRPAFANQAQPTPAIHSKKRSDGEFAQAGLAAQVAQAQSGFNAQNMARNQFMNEQFAMRNQPINEISSLLSGSQINNPNFVNTPNNQIPTTDVAGLINTRFSQDFGIYQQETQQQQALMGGIFGMLGGMMKMSDERMKENIVKVGSVFATDV